MKQKLKFLPRLASGESRCAVCFAEQGTGSDLNSGDATAEHHDEGHREGYYICGEKSFVKNAETADIFIVSAKMKVRNASEVEFKHFSSAHTGVPTSRGLNSCWISTEVIYFLCITII